ncbi:hypothetical protein D3C73_934510 [compost metagenome]
MTETEETRPNSLAAFGDMLLNWKRVIRIPTIISPATGVPALLTRAKIGGNRPSSAAAFAVCPASNVQPPSEPRHPAAAQKETIAPAVSPNAMRAASPNGEAETRSAALGIMPIIAVVEST